MGLDDFKFIFWWEWAHRFLGRLIGLAFALPFLYFLARGVISRALMPKLLAIFALGGLQGAVGWYMVQSGLADRIDVSPYRLALHLGVAFLILGAILWVALSLGAEERKSVRCLTLTPPQRRVAGILVVLVFLQILLGGLVAGTKAGLAYNTWPLMDGRLVPPGLAILSPWYLNLFENVLTVQFNHRLLAYLVAAVALWHAASVARTAVDEPVRWAALALAIAVLAQIALGIWTLLAVVPLSLGLAHQAGAVAVFTLAVWHLHRVTHT
jgi:cytochrome c oxidase assembly protein subunit 15